MQVTIRLDRAAAIRAGRDTFGDTIVAIDPSDLTPDEREALIAAPTSPGRSQIPDLSNTEGNVWPGKYPPPPALADADDPLAAARAWLAWRIACRVERQRVDAEAKAKAEQDREATRRKVEAYIAYWSQQPAVRFMPCVGRGGRGLPNGWNDEPNLPHAPDYDQSMREALAYQLDEARALLAIRQQEAEAEKAKAEQEKAASAARRTAQLAAWVQDHGTENQQGRARLGLLPEQEVLDAIRRVAYAPLDAFPRYQKIKATDVHPLGDCYEPGIECETVAADGMQSADYDAYRQIEEAAPAGAHLDVLEHRCHCPTCEAELFRRSVRVALQVGELEFTREYALAD